MPLSITKKTHLARVLLDEKRLEEFMNFMNMANVMESRHSFEFLIMYYFRYTQKILNFLLHILDGFHKVISIFKHILRKIIKIPKREV